MVTSVASGARQRLRAVGKLHVGQVHGVVDLEAGDVDLDELRNVVDRDLQVDGVGHDVDRAAALDAGRLFSAVDVQRHADANGRALAEPHEVDMDREVAHGIEVIVARDHAVLLALDIDLVNRGQEVTTENPMPQLAVVDRNRQGGWLSP